MIRFILVAFLFMGWGYYEMSGGAEFVAQTRADASTSDASATPAPAPAQDRAFIRVASPTTPAVSSSTGIVPEAVVTPAAMVTQPAVLTASNGVLSPEQAANIAPTFISLSRSTDGVTDAEATPAAASPDTLALATVDATRLNVRATPETGNNVVDQLPRGETVTLVETRGSWSLIRVEGAGVEGWVSSDYLVR